METRGKILEDLMTTVFRQLQEAEKLTEGKIDLEFILTIVGSYLTAKDAGDLEDDVREPAELFEERIFPIVDGSTITVEAIEDDEDGD
jgi:hypothetical protein